MKMIKYVLNSKDEFLNYGYIIRLMKKELNLQEYKDDWDYDWLL